MNTLKDSGLTLRTLSLADWATTLEDLNHNFALIMNNTSFRGRQGLKGEDGESVVGDRGSIWVFADTDRFIANYPAITTAEQVTLSFVNTALDSNQATLYDTLGYGDNETLSDNDIVVLPSGNVIQLQTDALDENSVLLPPQFFDTSITFEQVAGLTEDRVRQLISDILEPLTNNDVIVRLYTALAKTSSDKTGGANTQYTSQSAMDISVSESGSAPSVENHFYQAGVEAYVNSLAHICMIVGSPTLYHRIIQGTQEQLNNAYLPTVDSFNALAVLQNSYSNGITIGHKDETTFRNFARLYRSSSAFHVTSSYSPTVGEYSELVMSDILVKMRSPKNIIFEALELIGEAIPSIKFGLVTIDNENATVSIGNTTSQTTVTGSSFTVSSNSFILSNRKNAPFLSTDSQGNVVSLYTLFTDFDNQTTSHQSIPTSKAVGDKLAAIMSELTSLTNRVTALENADTTNIHKKLVHVTGGSLNVLREHGTYSLHGQSFVNLPSNMADNQTDTGVFSAILNVHRSPIATTDNNAEYLLQHIMSIEPSIQAFRHGVIRNNNVTFGEWQNIWDTENNAEFIKSGSGITVSWDGQEATVTHNTANSTITGKTIGSSDGKSAIRAIVFDTHGHPISVSSSDLDVYTTDEMTSLLEAELPVGSIIMWAGEVGDIPSRWALCDGKYYTQFGSQTSQPSVGTSFVNWVKSPDLKGRFVVGATVPDGQGVTDLNLASRQNGYEPHWQSYYSSRVPSVGNSGEFLTLQEEHLPDHTHFFRNIYWVDTLGAINQRGHTGHPRLVMPFAGYGEDASVAGKHLGLLINDDITQTESGIDHLTDFTSSNVGLRTYAWSRSEVPQTHYRYWLRYETENNPNLNAEAFDNRPPWYSLCYIIKRPYRS